MFASWSAVLFVDICELITASKPVVVPIVAMEVSLSLNKTALQVLGLQPLKVRVPFWQL